MTYAFSLKDKKVWVAGHTGMVGSAIVRRLENENCQILKATREKLDLTKQSDVDEWIHTNKPDVIFLAAAKVGGIKANQEYPAEFLHDNLAIQTNIIHAAYQNNVKKLLFLGSSCIYPKNAPQPLKEEYLLSGAIETTNEAYAVAKLAGIKLCESYRQQYGCNYISCLPTNLYGPNDNYDLESAHVPAALIRRIYEANLNGDKIIKIWGTGKPLREFLYVGDLADACVFLMKNYNKKEPANIGSGEEISIQSLANLIANIIGFEGDIKNDIDMPDGTPRKRLDLSKMDELGWKSKYTLEDSLKIAYKDFLKFKS